MTAVALGLVASPHVQNSLDGEGQRKNQPIQPTFAGAPRERFFLLYNEVAGKNAGPRQGDFERA